MVSQFAVPTQRARARLRLSDRSGRRTGRPFTYIEYGMPKTKGPEEDRDEVLNPAMKRRGIERCCRQMGRCGVDEDTDQNVDNNDEALGAEEGLYVVHRSSLPPCGRRTCCGALAVVKKPVAPRRGYGPYPPCQRSHVASRSRIGRLCLSATLTPREAATKPGLPASPETTPDALAQQQGSAGHERGDRHHHPKEAPCRGPEDRHPGEGPGIRHVLRLLCSAQGVFGT
jgi:hypothetical protein